MMRYRKFKPGTIMRSVRRFIQCRQETESWQPFKIAGGYPLRYDSEGNATGTGIPVGTGRCEIRKPKIPCLFRRSVCSHKLRKSSSKAAPVKVDHN